MPINSDSYRVKFATFSHGWLLMKLHIHSVPNHFNFNFGRRVKYNIRCPFLRRLYTILLIGVYETLEKKNSSYQSITFRRI
jgi:hypothetical protein